MYLFHPKRTTSNDNNPLPVPTSTTLSHTPQTITLLLTSHPKPPLPLDQSLTMAAYHNTLLFLGAGANVGAASVALFKSKGYRVASVARTIRDEVAEHSDLVLTADFSDPGAMQGVFDRVEERLGVPNVVVYNREFFAFPLLLIGFVWPR
jgi:NADPH:quinone reductase-like Zn-dependent oxidoreductase